MIKPTVGRVLWFYSYGNANSSVEPEAAIVCKVWSDTMVNLVVFDGDGCPRSERSIQLEQMEGVTSFRHARWMPYQLGQARAQIASDIAANAAQ